MPTRFLHRLTLLTLLALPVAAAAQQKPIAFQHAHVIPMDRERILDDQTVIIKDGQIAALGPYSSTKVPPHIQKIDATGRYLIPGLTDAHVHLYSTCLLYTSPSPRD